MNNAITAKLKFLANVKEKYPDLYRAAITRRGGSLNGLGITVEEMLREQDAFAEPKTVTTTNAVPWYTTALNTTIETIKNLAPAYIGVKQAQTCLEINAALARQGKPPIDCAAGGLAPQVSIGLSPNTQMLLFAALGIGALWLFKRK